MKIKLKDIQRAIEYFRYNGNLDENSYIEVSVREEDMDSGKLLSSLTITSTWAKEAQQYERIKTPKTITASIEMFPESENMAPKITTQESQDLDV